MSGQWEKYVEPAAVPLDPAAFDKTIENHDGYIRQFRRDRAIERARAVLAAVGPLIAEDTRVRMVEAAGRAIERETPSLYYCPISGEIEQQPGGGFDVCCHAPELHEPIAPQALAAARREAAQGIAIQIKTYRLQFNPDGPVATELYVAEEIARDFAAEGPS